MQNSSEVKINGWLDSHRECRLPVVSANKIALHRNASKNVVNCENYIGKDKQIGKIIISLIKAYCRVLENVVMKWYWWLWRYHFVNYIHYQDNKHKLNF